MLVHSSSVTSSPRWNVTNSLPRYISKASTLIRPARANDGYQGSSSGSSSPCAATATPMSATAMTGTKKQGFVISATA